MLEASPIRGFTLRGLAAGWSVRSTPLLHVSWQEDRFVATGWYGLLLESPDGLSWHEVPTPTLEALTASALGEGRRVVVGGKATRLQGPPGGPLEPSKGTPLEHRGLWGVAYGRGRYVAVGMEGLVLTSGDGRAWEPVPLGLDRNLWGVAFAQGRFVAVGDHIILVSQDGRHFETLPAPGILNAVAFAQGLFLAVGWGGLILTSQDGRSWHRQASGTWKGLFGIARSERLWVVVGEGGTVLTSSDGIRWHQAVLEGAPFLTGVAWNGSRFVAVGWGLALYTSEDGLAWEPLHPGTGQQLWSVAFGPQGFVAVGHEGPMGIVLFSPEGTAWTLEARVPAWLLGVGWGRGQYVAVGERGTILLSPNGKRWVKVETPVQKWLYAVAYGEDRFVAAGEALLLSREGKVWRAFPLPQEETLLGLTFGAGTFLAAGEKGNLYASRDGIRWEKVLSLGRPWLRGLVHGNGRFVASGHGKVLVAQRGWDWEEASAPHLPKHLPSVAHGDGRFALVGHPRPGEGVVAFSEDGLAWDEAHPLGNEPEGIACGQGRFVVVGNCGTLLTWP
ncbi:sialidase family protein [Thermus tengchongensis]|uniref:Photosynthesis system II assembly factor Ycf48/Hcf136-like domain-containing protein n=1 Tax=Thermus tengchongensis TaxID=1214928 RepID=A0ABY2K8P9_9DEIN|nr:hypothetical protein [Thermus tengchongensis]TFU17617.1 hypothetical protein E0489_02235 [Thermus tengchongensis]